MTRESLVCANGHHTWSRDAKRGRKPTSCPQHPKPVLITKAGTVLTPQLEQELTEEAEAGYEIVGYVDVEPVTLRSTKTSKEAPESPAEPFTPRLATEGAGRGQGASSDSLDGRNGQNSQDPSPELLEEADLDVQVLYCANGDHEWTRPAGRRGRKPVNCPKHPNMIDLEANAEERRRKAEERIDRLEADLKRHGTHISQHQPKEFTVPNRPEYQDKAKGSAGSLKGSRRTVKATKRTEAEARNEKTVPERRSRKTKAA